MIFNKLGKLLFSARLMALLFIIFAIAMAVGTFLEDAYGTTAARIWVYNAWWFEAIMLFFMINFCGNIFRYRLHKKDKWPTLLLHLSFILILLGAFVTRYIGFEGLMPISEGETTSKFLSEKIYLNVFIDGQTAEGPRRKTLSKHLELTEATNNDFTLNTHFNTAPVSINYVGYIEGAERKLVATKEGDNYLKLVEASDGERHEHYLKEGEISVIHNIPYAFNNQTDGVVNISFKDNAYFIDSPVAGNYIRMIDQLDGILIKDSLQPLMLRSLYTIKKMQFVIPDPVFKAIYDVVPIKNKAKGQKNAVLLNVTSNGESKVIKLLGGLGFEGKMKKMTLGGLNIHLGYGSKLLELPFKLKLNDFIAEKYPGTEKVYKSYMSKVEIINGTVSKPYDIFMNNILDYEGYRFFQSSFNPEENGTVLSVNHDFWGTWITYIGYFLLYLGLMLILFIRGSRFKDLEVMLNKIKSKKKALTVLVILSFSYTNAQDELERNKIVNQLDSIIISNSVSKAHAANFGSLVIQDESGRMKPMNTFSSELLRKLSKKDTYKNLNADQVVISMIENPLLWYNVPIIYLKRENDSLRKLLSIPKEQKYIALVNLFDKENNYKLSPYLEAASKTNKPSSFQKDFIKTHEKFYLLDETLNRGLLRLFPIPNDTNNKWVSSMFKGTEFKTIDSLYVKQVISLYTKTLFEARENGDYSKADKYISRIKKFQKKYGSQVLPSDRKLEMEIAYNTYDVFRNLFKYYMYLGVLLLFFVVFQIFKDSRMIRILITTSIVIIILLFVLHTAALVVRWYVSGHAPWSDAYESMIYVGWATLFFGLAFGRKSNLTIGATAFVTSIILMIAHWNWMDPAIANLQPVLDSYWLMIHVAIIVASYGPFILGAILGVVALLLIILTTNENKQRMDLSIKEITVINEMSLTVGLVMLTIGNFLGGQWANESWGRYWGWDPKETWALISIMIYAFVIHMRLVPGLRGKWWFNLSSVIAISSIMMTYFGVNFYLSGLHSYASGDKVVTPNFVYYSVVFIISLGAVSYWRYKIHYIKKN